MTLARATSEIVGIEARLQWVRLMGSEGVETVVLGLVTHKPKSILDLPEDTQQRVTGQCLFSTWSTYGLVNSNDILSTSTQQVINKSLLLNENY